MGSDLPGRPEPGPHLTGTELARWYWLKTELVDLARLLGVSTAGSKAELAGRLVVVLDGGEPSAVGPRPRTGPAASQLTEPLTDETIIPRGQRSSQVLRAYFEARIGPSFRFDGAMRSFVADGAGKTLGEAVDHWHRTRDAAPAAIGEQFELNRFTRTWHGEHPGGTRAELLAAWRRYRSLPIEERRRA